MRFRTVFFDLDGTLVDHFAAIHRSHAHTLRSLGLPEPTMETVRRAVGAGVEVAVQRVLGPDRADLVPRALPIYRSYWANTMLDDVELLPGARELLQRLHARGVACAVLTNKHATSARLICTHLGLDPLLAGVFGAGDAPALKPDLAFTRHALAALNATAEGACLVGDSPYDIETGRVAGFPCYVVTTGTHTADELQAAGADGVFANLSGLASVLLTP